MSIKKTKEKVEVLDLFSLDDEEVEIDFSVNKIHEGYVEPDFSEEIEIEEKEEDVKEDFGRLPDPFVLLEADKEDGLDTDYPYFIAKLEEEIYGVDEYQVDEDYIDDDEF